MAGGDDALGEQDGSLLDLFLRIEVGQRGGDLNKELLELVLTIGIIGEEG